MSASGKSSSLVNSPSCSLDSKTMPGTQGGAKKKAPKRIQLGSRIRYDSDTDEEEVVKPSVHEKRKETPKKTQKHQPKRPPSPAMLEDWIDDFPFLTFKTQEDLQSYTKDETKTNSNEVENDAEEDVTQKAKPKKGYNCKNRPKSAQAQASNCSTSRSSKTALVASESCGDLLKTPLSSSRKGKRGLSKSQSLAALPSVSVETASLLEDGDLCVEEMDNVKTRTTSRKSGGDKVKGKTTPSQDVKKQGSKGTGQKEVKVQGKKGGGSKSKKKNHENSVEQEMIDNVTTDEDKTESENEESLITQESNKKKSLQNSKCDVKKSGKKEKAKRDARKVSPEKNKKKNQKLSSQKVRLPSSTLSEVDARLDQLALEDKNSPNLCKSPRNTEGAGESTEISDAQPSLGGNIRLISDRNSCVAETAVFGHDSDKDSVFEFPDKPAVAPTGELESCEVQKSRIDGGKQFSGNRFREMLMYPSQGDGKMPGDAAEKASSPADKVKVPDGVEPHQALLLNLSSSDLKGSKLFPTGSKTPLTALPDLGYSQHPSLARQNFCRPFEDHPQEICGGQEKARNSENVDVEREGKRGGGRVLQDHEFTVPLPPSGLKRDPFMRRNENLPASADHRSSREPPHKKMCPSPQSELSSSSSSFPSVAHPLRPGGYSGNSMTGLDVNLNKKFSPKPWVSDLESQAQANSAKTKTEAGSKRPTIIANSGVYPGLPSSLPSSSGSSYPPYSQPLLGTAGHRLHGTIPPLGYPYYPPVQPTAVHLPPSKPLEQTYLLPSNSHYSNSLLTNHNQDHLPFVSNKSHLPNQKLNIPLVPGNSIYDDKLLPNHLRDWSPSQRPDELKVDQLEQESVSKAHPRHSDSRGNTPPPTSRKYSRSRSTTPHSSRSSSPRDTASRQPITPHSAHSIATGQPSLIDPLSVDTSSVTSASPLLSSGSTAGADRALPGALPGAVPTPFSLLPVIRPGGPSLPAPTATSMFGASLPSQASLPSYICDPAGPGRDLYLNRLPPDLLTDYHRSLSHHSDLPPGPLGLPPLGLPHTGGLNGFVSSAAAIHPSLNPPSVATGALLDARTSFSSSEKDRDSAQRMQFDLPFPHNRVPSLPGYPTTPPSLPGMLPTPHGRLTSGGLEPRGSSIGPSLSSSAGAFQPKHLLPTPANMMMMGREKGTSGSVSGSSSISKKPTSAKWCVAHVRVAWLIHFHKQRLQQQENQSKKMGTSPATDGFGAAGHKLGFPGEPFSGNGALGMGSLLPPGFPPGRGDVAPSAILNSAASSRSALDLTGLPPPPLGLPGLPRPPFPGLPHSLPYSTPLYPGLPLTTTTPATSTTPTTTAIEGSSRGEGRSKEEEEAINRERERESLSRPSSASHRMSRELEPRPGSTHSRPGSTQPRSGSDRARSRSPLRNGNHDDTRDSNSSHSSNLATSHMTTTPASNGDSTTRNGFMKDEAKLAAGYGSLLNGYRPPPFGSGLPPLYPDSLNYPSSSLTASLNMFERNRLLMSALGPSALGPSADRYSLPPGLSPHLPPPWGPRPQLDMTALERDQIMARIAAEYDQKNAAAMSLYGAALYGSVYPPGVAAALSGMPNGLSPASPWGKAPGYLGMGGLGPIPSSLHRSGGSSTHTNSPGDKSMSGSPRPESSKHNASFTVGADTNKYSGPR